MPHIWTYRLATDGGVAPHISDGILTLTLCKPVIRKGAAVGDYVLAIVSKGLRTKAQINNNAASGYKFRAAYLFKVEEIVELSKYKEWCEEHAEHKICKAPIFFGDCQYDKELKYIEGPHGPNQQERNLRGVNSLISRTYAAWTAANARVITKEEIESMGINYEQIGRVTQGQFKTPITPVTQVAIDTLIEEGPKPYASKNSINMGAPGVAPVLKAEEAPVAAEGLAVEGAAEGLAVERAAEGLAVEGAAAVVEAPIAAIPVKKCCGKKGGGTRKKRYQKRKTKKNKN